MTFFSVCWIVVSWVLRAFSFCCWVCSAVTGRFWISIIWDTILAVSRPDARPVTWSAAPLADDVVVVGELLETDEVDISTLVIG